MLKAADPTFKYYFCLHANETLCRLENTPKLCIAALNGHTVGGGLEVALACDLRVARKGAGKVGLPEVALGVLPGTGGTQRLARVVGKSRAIQLMVEGATFDFDTAQGYGLVNEVWETATHAEFMERVLAYARRFTTPGRASLAVGRIKRAVQSGARGGAGAGARPRARAAGRALRVRGRARGPRRLRREAAAGVQGALRRRQSAGAPRHPPGAGARRQKEQAAMAEPEMRFVRRVLALLRPRAREPDEPRAPLRRARRWRWAAWRAGLLTRRRAFFLAAPVVGYGFAWVGHFFVEGNKPATFKHPLWSLRGDLVMWWKTDDRDDGRRGGARHDRATA